MEQREDLYVDAMRSIGSIITGLHIGETEDQPIELYQLSHVLDLIFALAPQREKRTVGLCMAILRTLHHGHLTREVGSATGPEERD